jgi:hypothetical protein
MSSITERHIEGIIMRPGRLLAMAILLASLAIAGCTSRNAPTTSAAPTPTTPSPVTTTATGGPTTTVAPPSSAGPGAATCAETRAWGTGAKQSAASSTAPLYLIRVGRHDCYDRVVFDVNAVDAVGYHVQYVEVVSDDGSGTPRPVAGGAALEVVIRAPAQGFDSQGHQPGRFLAQPGQVLYSPAQLAGWPSLREVRYANSFEGQTTIAVGVRARVPFRAFTLLSTRDQVMRVVLDIAR